MIVAIIAGPAVFIGADQRRSEYYEGLRSRRLFSIAEEDCLRRLADDDLADGERAELTIQLSKTFAAHAAFAAGDERVELWTRAEEVLDDFLRAEPLSRFAVLVTTQRAMVPATRGTQLRWHGELFPLDEQTRRQAVATLQDAYARLRPLPELLKETLRSSSTATRGDIDEFAVPAPHRVHRLIRDVEYATAVAALDLAKVQQPSADRTAALHDADTRFDTLARIARPDRIAWGARIHRLEIMRLRRQTDRLEGQVRAFLMSDPPNEFRDAAVAVLVRSSLADNLPDEALATLDAHRQEHGLESPELQALLVESLLAARRIAREKDDEPLADELLKRSEQLDAQLDGTWRLRTRLLLEQAREEDRYGPELAATVRDANWAWKNGQTETAIAAFGRAATEAHQQGLKGFAVEFALTTASVQLESGRFEDAVRSLAELLRAYPDADQAAEADLLRAYALGRIYEQQPSPLRKEAYRESLLQHREAFANSATAGEAAWMLARLLEQEQAWEPTLELLAAVPLQSPRRPSAVVRTAAILERVISEARDRNGSTEQWERRAIETLSEAVDAFPSAPTRLTQEQAEVASTFARILLRRLPPSFFVADTLLGRVIDSGRAIERDSGRLDPSWHSLVAAASQWRIISLTGQGRLAEARTVLEQVEVEQPDRLLDVLDGLAEIAGEIGMEHRRDLGQMQLELAERLKARLTSLSEAQRRQLDVALAQAQAAIGQWQTAARLYEEILWRLPKDQEVLRALAMLYEQCETSSCLRQAMEHWQTLQALHRKGSVEWLEARYHMAWCSHRLGDNDVARKLISVTQVLYPQLGRPSLKARFEALWQEIASGTQK